MRILILDTETTGLVPKGVRQVNMNTVNMYPYIIQFSYLICDNGEIEKTVNHIIRLPKEIVMNEKNMSIHKITNEMSQEQGSDIKTVLLEFGEDLKNNINLIVAHNTEFDWNVIKAEYLRVIKNNIDTNSPVEFWNVLDSMTLMSRNLYCTMKESVSICKLTTTSKDGSEFEKWPKLEELHKCLFGVVPINLHNSLNDCFVCLRCFYKMKYDKDICLENQEVAMKFIELLPVESEGALETNIESEL